MKRNLLQHSADAQALRHISDIDAGLATGMDLIGVCEAALVRTAYGFDELQCHVFKRVDIVVVEDHLGRMRRVGAVGYLGYDVRGL